MWTLIPVSIALALEAVAVFLAWRAVRTARTPQGSVGWVVFLLAAPWFAIPAYFLFGSHKYREAEEARHASKKITDELKPFGEHHAPGGSPDTRAKAFERIGLLPITGGNDARLLIDGKETFEAIFAAIEGAERDVCVQFYTIMDDELGTALGDRLVAATKRGVAVRLLYDGVGSYGLSGAFTTRLSDAGVDVVNPRAARGPTSRLAINFRNHRKTVVVDGRIGFIGGHNVSDTYMGRNPKYGPWRDTHLEIRGPMVTQLQLIFAEDWHWGTGKRLDGALDWAPEKVPADMDGMIVATGPGDEMDTGAMFHFSAIAVAEKRVWIASPYFVPDTDVLSALKHAALRGTDVRIIVPGKPDHYLTWLAAHAFYDEVRSAGVKIYHHAPGFMHQKVVLVDDDIAAVGSLNLDNRSFRLNFEAMALFFDAGFNAQVAEMLERDMAASTMLELDLDAQPLWLRVAAPFARLFAPIL